MNNGAKGAIAGAVAGIFSQVYLNDYYGYSGMMKFLQHLKRSFVGLVAGGFLASAATLLVIVNREEKK